MLATPREWEWSGKGAVRFAPSGAFESPWGAGSWGSVPSPWRKDSLHVKLAGEANPSLNPSFDDPDPDPNPGPQPHHSPQLNPNQARATFSPPTLTPNLTLSRQELPSDPIPTPKQARATCSCSYRRSGPSSPCAAPTSRCSSPLTNLLAYKPAY